LTISRFVFGVPTQMLAYARAEVPAPALALARKSYEVDHGNSSDPALLPVVALDAACDRDQVANAAFLAQVAEHRARGTHVTLSEEKVGVFARPEQSVLRYL
jgi:hypothetical protein